MESLSSGFTRRQRNDSAARGNAPVHTCRHYRALGRIRSGWLRRAGTTVALLALIGAAVAIVG